MSAAPFKMQTLNYESEMFLKMLKVKKSLAHGRFSPWAKSSCELAEMEERQGIRTVIVAKD